MATVRRHWKLLLTHLLLVLVMGLGLGWHLLRNPAVSIGSEPGGGQVTPLDAVTYSRVQALREQLTLGSHELAALGLNQEQAQQVLTAALSWQQANGASMSSAEASVAAAEGAYREAVQRAGQGESVGLGELRSSLKNALAARQTLLDGAATSIRSGFTSEQATAWDLARGNRALPQRYRHVPGLSAQESASLRLAWSRGGAGSPGAVAAEGSVVTGNRLTAMNAAKTAAAESIEGVLAAEAASLPD